MAKKWRDLYARIPPERRACIEADVAQDLAEMALAEGRVKLPLVECAHEARAGEEMTPEQVANALLAEEAASHRE